MISSKTGLNAKTTSEKWFEILGTQKQKKDRYKISSIEFG
jgi:hypothetical protein